MRDALAHRRATDYDKVASRDDLARDGSMRGDNTAAWEERCSPVLELLATQPLTMSEVRAWGRSYRPHKGASYFGSNLAEECLYWLERRGRVVRGDDRKWRVK